MSSEHLPIISKGKRKDMTWEDSSGKGVRVVIIDSGVNSEHELLKNYRFKGIAIEADLQGEVSFFDDYSDELGHGTAVSFVCQSHIPEAEIYIVKIFHDKGNADENSLIAALDYIAGNIECDIINISCGVHMCERLCDLENACSVLDQKGVTIVAAFESYGRVSYPAAFEKVIGVDATLSCYKANEYQYVEGDMVNVRGSLCPRRLPSINNDYLFDGGASFVAPYISALLAKMISVGINSRADMLEELKNNAIKTYKSVYYEEVKRPDLIRKAILFPFNKEMHSLVRHYDKLDFDIIAIYDTKYSQNVGKTTDILLKYGNVKLHKVVENIDKIDWTADFDTVILGCTSKMVEALKKDVRHSILENCLRYDKNVYCYEEGDKQKEWETKFVRRGLTLYCPSVYEYNVRKNSFGKLFECSKPVLLIAGTSPKQGKFNLQIRLRNEFLKQGYSVGQLGTEPSSLLFGMDEIYNMGFNSTVHLAGGMAVSYVNELLHRIEKKSPDIIIAGAQSQTLPSASGNLGYYPLEQYEFILGVQPDACVLCVTVLDDIEYVQRTINYIQAINECTVIGIMLFPYRYVNSYGYLIGDYEKVNESTVEEYKDSLAYYTNLKVFNASNDDDYSLICSECITFFGEK